LKTASILATTVTFNSPAPFCAMCDPNHTKLCSCQLC